MGFGLDRKEVKLILRKVSDTMEDLNIKSTNHRLLTFGSFFPKGTLVAWLIIAPATIIGIILGDQIAWRTVSYQ